MDKHYHEVLMVALNNIDLPIPFFVSGGSGE